MILNEIRNQLLEKQKTWVVTGVAGFIGSSLLDFLLSAKQRVIGIDNFSTGFQHNLDDVLSKHQSYKELFVFHELDIRDYDACLKVCAGAAYLLHQAALGSVPRSIKTPEITNDVNVNGFLSMLRVARDVGIQSVVYASSSSVYGNSTQSPKQEAFLGDPLSPYAVSKRTNELYAESFARCYNLSLTGLRYFNVFGPRQNPQGPYAAVIPLWIQSFINKTELFVNGDGQTSRDFTFIDNVVQANILSALKGEELKEGHHILNIAAGKQTTLEQLKAMIAHEFSVLDRDIQSVYRDFRSGDVRHSLADISKAQENIGYLPSCHIQEGIQKTCDWYRSILGSHGNH